MSTATALPEYARIKQSLVAAIEGGRWPVGSVIPSEAQLSAEHGVSRATVVRSLQELALAGYLFRQKGRGTFVADFRHRRDAGGRAAPVPLFISEQNFRRSGSGRQVLLRVLSGIEEVLGPAHPGVSLRQTPAVLTDATRRLIDETRPPVALVVEPSFNPALVAHLRRTGCLTWVINEPVDDADCVYVNQERAGYLATAHLLGQGRRRVALLNGPVDAYWGFAARYRGYAAALAAAGVPVDPALHRQGGSHDRLRVRPGDAPRPARRRRLGSTASWACPTPRPWARWPWRPSGAWPCRATWRSSASTT